MTNTCDICNDENLWKFGYCRRHYLTEIEGWTDWDD